MTRWEAETLQTLALIDAGHPRLAAGLAVLRSLVVRIVAGAAASGALIWAGLPSALIHVWG